jgi:hypothetical protein
MKKLILLIVLFTCSQYIFGQLQKAETWAYQQIENEEVLSKDADFTNYGCNIKDAIIHSKTDITLGFIGANYQRIRVRFTAVKQDAKRNHVFTVTGKTLVKNNLVNFTGTIVVQSFASIKKGDKESNMAIVKYKLIENTTQKFAGVFEGYAVLNLRCQKGGAYYNNDEQDADGFYNNQFVGIWTSNATKASKPCNLGDYRIPNCGDLDVGAGEFLPAQKYLQYGWQGYYNAQINLSNEDLRIENAKWWLEKR